MIITKIIAAALFVLWCICLPILLKKGQRFDELLKDKLNEKHHTKTDA